MQSVGQAWLVLQLTGSPLRLGLIGTLQFAPVLLFSLYRGRRRSPAQAAGAPRHADRHRAARPRARLPRALRPGRVLARLRPRLRARLREHHRHAHAPVLRGRAGRQGRYRQCRRAELRRLQHRPHRGPGGGRASHRPVRRGHRLHPQRPVLRGGDFRALPDAKRGAAARRPRSLRPRRRGRGPALRAPRALHPAAAAPPLRGEPHRVQLLGLRAAAGAHRAAHGGRGLRIPHGGGRGGGGDGRAHPGQSPAAAARAPA